MTTLAELQPGGPIQVIFYGAPKTGKTVMAHGFPRSRTLDCDNGMLSVMWAIKQGIIKKTPEEVYYETILEVIDKRGFITRSTAHDKVRDTAAKWIEEESDEWDTIILDSATSFNDYCLIKALENMDQLKKSKSLKSSREVQMLVTAIQDYMGAGRLFKNFTDWLRPLEKNVIVICHEFDEKTKEGYVRAKKPLLLGASRESVTKDFSEVWHFRKEVKRGEVEYIVNTEGDDLFVAGSRLGCLEANETDLTYAKVLEKVTNFWK